jgi:D-tagatose-1,6-bisphosphate aldolase subunit GatZ/KbaZ
VQQAVDRLLANLEQNPPPLTLLSQFVPQQFAAVRAGTLAPSARELVLHHVELVLQQYAAACSDSPD